MKINQINLLSLAEQKQIEKWSMGKILPISDKTVVQLFEEQALTNPNAIALISANHLINYANLNKQANQIAHYLLNRGVKTGDIIGLCGKHSPE